ncbi:MAG: carboxypeptidase regulatory-like domain-containing protein [Deltaproteobacteria bacterium]|nr:carboxypeptidase regulatory-like domain-containing protein [Deltaproteobacteria bacterium]
MRRLRNAALTLLAGGGLGAVLLLQSGDRAMAPLPRADGPVTGATPAERAPAIAAPRPAPLECEALAATAPADRRDSAVRQAAHRGLAYLAKSSRAWTDQHSCFGCHVQAVTMEALSSGQHFHYDVARDDLDHMVRVLKMGVTAGGRVTGAAFQGAAWARYDRFVNGEHTGDLLQWAAELVTLQSADGAVIDDDARRPITGGTMQTTFQAAQTWRQAFARTADEKWLLPLRRAETFLAATANAWKPSGEDADLQDANFALLGLVASGAGRGEASSQRLQRMLLARQNKDGGWSLDRGASDAFATGQTVYALKLAGYSDSEDPIARGLQFLLAHQDQAGSWHTYRSGQGGAEKGETMWAVLGLVTVDVASVTVAGLVDGQHVKDTMQIAVSAADNGTGGIAKLELVLDDLPLDAACGPTLRHDWDTRGLAGGMHVLEVVATNARGQQARRRFEVYAGDVQLTHVTADYDESLAKTVVTLRNIVDDARGKVALEVWSALEGADPKPGAKVFAVEKPGVPGPMSFEWAGLGDDGKARPRGRYFAKVSFRDPDGRSRQTETVLFLHDSEEAQKAQFGEVEGQLSLENGARGAANTVVELVDDQGKVVQATRTTEQGNYRFKNVASGGYKVRTRKGGFTDLEAPVEARAGGAPASASMSW